MNLPPADVEKLAVRQFERPKADPFHPSLHVEKVGRRKQLWSARVGIGHRVLGLDKLEGVVWAWIGTHADYDRLLR